MKAREAPGVRDPSLADALIPLVSMIIMLTWSIVLFGIDAAAGPLQVALLMSAVVAAVVVSPAKHGVESRVSRSSDLRPAARRSFTPAY